MELHPLKFAPIFKEKIWGGSLLSDFCQKNNTPDSCGESWEISNVKGDISVITNGSLNGTPFSSAIETYKEALVGKVCYQKYGTDFPLLIKFLDAQQDLSLQVHPDDTVARAKHNSFGKNEMWYILNAEKDARVITGFKKDVSKEEVKNSIEDNTILSLTNEVPVAADDVINVPAGRIHTIGAGIVLAEIQQSSDVTYRIYDFDRKDKSGNKRELHIEDSLEALDLKELKEPKTSYSKKENEEYEIVWNQYFHVSKLDLTKNYNLKNNGDSFKILINVGNTVTIENGNNETVLKPYETVLIPASILESTISVSEEKASLLLAYIV